VLVNGEIETGVTLHHMTPRPDDGDIVGQRRIAIDDDDTALTLHRKMSATAAGLLDDLLPRLSAGTAERTPQDPDLASYFGRRKPADGEIDWNKPAAAVRNLVRAVTRPYPGAFTHMGDRRILLWQVDRVPSTEGKDLPGTVVRTDPLIIACGEDAVQVRSGQAADGVMLGGSHLASDVQVVPGSRLGRKASAVHAARRKKRVLILGINGFIGNHLTERLLGSGRYEVYGMDLGSSSLARFDGHPDFTFREGDISIHRDWIEYHVKKCDIVLPLVAIATPIEYTRNPLRVFELDFEENLRVVRYCVRNGKRLLFPSTSEVYGMATDEEFDEDRTNLVLGPIHRQRWIYSCSKQLLDRVIWAYGATEGLRFTLFRPFNWIGPRLDTLAAARIGSSRAITQLILNLTDGTPILLIDGGEQKRCFTDVRDGIEALFRIVETDDGTVDGRIINIGSPDNEASIRQLAELLIDRFDRHPLRRRFPPFAGFRRVESNAFYGPGYEDVQFRRPSVRNAERYLGWKPEIGLAEAVEGTLDFFLRESVRVTEAPAAGDRARGEVIQTP